MKHLNLKLTMLAAVFLLIACERNVGNDSNLDSGSNQNDDIQVDAEVPNPGYLSYEVNHFIFTAPHMGATIPITMIDFITHEGEGAQITSLTFKLHGSIDLSEIVSLNLYHENPLELIATNYSWDGRYATFDLTASPIEIPADSMKTYSLRIELNADPCDDTVGFDIDQNDHIVVVGSISGSGYNVVEGPLSESAEPVRVLGNQVMFSFAPDNPLTAEVAVGAVGKEDHVFVEYNVHPLLDVCMQQTSIRINLSEFTSVYYFSDVKLWSKNVANQWVLIAAPITLSTNDCRCGVCELFFAYDYYMMACEHSLFRVTMGILSGAPQGTHASIDVVTGDFLILDVLRDPDLVHSDNIMGGTLYGNPQKVIF